MNYLTLNTERISEMMHESAIKVTSDWIHNDSLPHFHKQANDVWL